MLKKRNNHIWLPLAAILALIAVAFLAAPAFAQDEPPTEPAPEEVPVEEIPAEELPALEEIPEGVEVVPTGAEGEVLPLASEEAAEVLAGGDPWWKVGTHTYRYLRDIGDPTICTPYIVAGETCVIHATPIQAAVDYIAANAIAIPTDGKIYVEAGAFANEDITISGSNVNHLKLKGLIGHLSPTTNLPDAILTNSTIMVGNMPGAFLLSGFNITSSGVPSQIVYFFNNSGPMTLQDMVVTNPDTTTGAVAIKMVQTGAITLTRVDSSSNGENSAFLDNSTGTAAITINNATFDGNAGTVGAALTISSKGVIALNNVSAAHNADEGASITTLKSLSIKNSTFHHNTGNGLTIPSGSIGSVNLENVYMLYNTSDGVNITLGGIVNFKNVMADHNNRIGARIITCGGSPCTLPNAGAVTISNSTFNSNHQFEYTDSQAGLIIWAKGAISLTGVDASFNGIYIDGTTNALTSGATLMNDDAASPVNITITQSTFNNNFWTGLRIETKGSVKLNTISASSNSIPAAPDWQIYGMDINASTGSGSVTLTSTLGDSVFDNNDGHGIVIAAKGTVSLSGKIGGDSTASSNGTGSEGSGMWVDNAAGTGSVIIKNFGILSNQRNGLRVLSKGAITLDTLDVNNNGVGAESIGADIANNSAPSAKAVIITASTFQGNVGEGLHVYTKGSVTLNSIIASSNTSGASDPSGAIISATDGTGSVTLLGSKGINYFSGNDGCGLVIYANGKVSIDKLETYNNAGDDGVYINTSTAGDVVVKNLQSYLNGNAGLYVQAFGNITVDNVNIYANGLVDSLHSGAYLYNAGGILAKTVTVTRSAFLETPTTGLIVDSRGLITINHISSEDNTSGGGAFLQNDYAGSTAGVSVLSSYGSNVFGNNEGTGLDIQSNGSVLISKAHSSENHGDGVHVLNTGGTGSVTINTGYFVAIYGSAIHIQSNGKISISDVTAFGNGTVYGGPAIDIDNSTSPVIETTVTVMRTYVDNQQQGTGINILSKGVVTLNTVTSSGNSTLGSYGVNIDNRPSSKNAGISILGSYGRNEFASNANFGLYLNSDGTITISKADVNANGATGAYLDNRSGNGSMIITDSYFDNNPNSAGIQIYTYGNVTWTGGGASNNGLSVSGHGAQIINSSGPSPMPVSISKVIFDYNRGHGIYVQANGQITLNKVTASTSFAGSGGYGAYLENSGWTGGVSVLSSYGANYFSSNDQDGLYIHTTGTVILSKVTANGNDRYGVEIDNQMPGSTASVSFSTGNIDQNTNTGLYIRSNGAISVTSLNARWNGFMLGTGYGADLNNALGANKAITVTKSLFQENDNGGISALSNGAITLNAVQLIQNNGRGANLLNTLGTGKVDILSSMGKTKIYENTNTGLRILSAGTVTISGIEVYQNIGIGIGIDNSTGVGNVTFSGCTVFDNDNIGADVASSGVININNSKLDHNAAYGARIINTADTSGTKGVTVKNSTFSGNTGGYGLRIESHGTVLMTTVKAENNNGEGAWINNLAGTTTGTSIVTISGINSFSNNNNDGLVVYGKGAVTLAGITALNNNGVGMFLNTDTGSTINISNATLKQNNENGIYALSGGAINISGMVVLFNGTTANYSGAYLSATGYDLTIKNSAFNANGASGIVAYTGATHTLYLTGVNYFGNDYFGGLVDPDLSFDGHLVLN